MTQKFRGDYVEQRFEDAGSAAFDVCSSSLDQYYNAGYQSNDFLLMLYDAKRMPFTDRVPRDAFVRFIREAITRFPTCGTFEFYLFILRGLFGADASILFNIPAAGRIEVLVSAALLTSFDSEVREFGNDQYVSFQLGTSAGDTLQFRGISGISSEYQLFQLLSELVPAGIFQAVTLAYFSLSDFWSSAGDAIVDSLGNQIIFFENA